MAAIKIKVSYALLQESVNVICILNTKCPVHKKKYLIVSDDKKALFNIKPMASNVHLICIYRIQYCQKMQGYHEQ